MKKLTLPDWLKLDQKFQRIFYAMTALFGIYVLPIILADRYYQDDLSRSLSGITGWNNDARPLTEFIMKWLCGGTPISDISPLPLLLSILFLAYTLTLYIQKNLSAGHSVFILLYVGFLVISNPFLLSTLSYKYDCVTMILALCAAVFPYVLPDEWALWKVFVFSAFMCMITLTTYQPCCGVYIGLVFLELFFMIFSSKIHIARLVIHAVSMGICIPPYYFIIMKHYIADSSWQQSAYHFALDSSFFTSIFQNINSLVSFMQNYLTNIPLYVIVLFCGLICCGTIYTAFLIWTSDTSAKTFKTLYIICLPVLITIFSVLPLLVLTPSIFSVSGHTLIVLSAFGLWAGIMLHILSYKADKIVILMLIPCMLFSMSYSYTYGNALKTQKNYEEYVTYNIVHDIETINSDYDYQYLSINGKSPRSPELLMLCEKYPIFKHMVPVYITNNSYLGGAILQHYMLPELTFSSMTQEDTDVIENSTPLISNALYSCYTNGDKIIIQFETQNE